MKAGHREHILTQARAIAQHMSENTAEMLQRDITADGRQTLRTKTR